jgi:histone acetyltransferase (RNA polymerase elongator complex component)
MNILPIFLPLQGCSFQCVYCDQNVITNTLEIDYSKIKESIDKFCQNNEQLYKEIAFYGGTFTNLKKADIDNLLKLTDPYINDLTGLRISTRPDYITKDQLKELADRGLRTVELGIQSFSDKVLETSRRFYSKITARKACEIIRSCGLNLGIQLMPGLPGSDPYSLEESISITIGIKPEYIRIYPTVILKNTILENWYDSGEFSPLSLQEAIKISADMIERFEEADIKVIKTGLHSDIDSKNIIAGPYHESFGELVRMELMLKKIIANYQENKTFVISKYDVSLFKGFKKKLLEQIKVKLKRERIPVIVESHKRKGELTFTDQKPDLFW